MPLPTKSRNLLQSLPIGSATYLLVCSDNSFYTGLTDDLAIRISDHASGRGGGYTKSIRPMFFVWYESHLTREAASTREFQIKSWSREKKQRLSKRIAPFDFGECVRIPLDWS